MLPPVSYTHLDVYKRQTPDEQVVFGKQDYFEKIDTDLNNEIKWIIPNTQKNVMEPIPVSYTHLDVYKRQQLFSMIVLSVTYKQTIDKRVRKC